ncbi:MAG: hypothetical protein QM725_02520 [Lacibacter sp.]
MFKVLKYPLFLFVAGLLITLTGAFLKILHYPCSGFLLTVGMLIQAVGLIYSVYILVKTK